MEQKTAKLKRERIKKFTGPYLNIKYAYTDGSNELYKAFTDLGIPHDHSTVHRPQTNGVEERAVRRVKEGTSCCLVQSGLHECWWTYAMECYCTLRNIVDIVANKDKTPFELRYSCSWYGPIIPFGAYAHYLPLSPQDKSRTHQFGNKWLKGIFLGYEDMEGGGWSQRLYVVDWEELENAAKPENVYVK